MNFINSPSYMDSIKEWPYHKATEPQTLKNFDDPLQMKKAKSKRKLLDPINHDVTHRLNTVLNTLSPRQKIADKKG